MAGIKLTKRLIDAAECPEDGQTFLRDSEIPGFAVRLTKGAKTFVLEKRINGRPRRVTIGPYGALTLEQARDEARKLIGRIVSGENPAQEKIDRRSELTFGDLKDRFLEDYAPRKRQGAVKDDRNRLNRHTKQWWTRKLSEITRADVSRLHIEIGKTAPAEANRVASLIRRLFNLARNWGMYSGENPATHIERFREKSRDRFIQPDELPRLLKALAEEENPYVRGALIISLFTGARIGEVRRMKWSDVDFGQGLWRLPETKAGRPHLLPLPSYIVDHLKGLPRMAGSPYVFPGKQDGHIGDLAWNWNRIKKRAGITDIRQHDLRRTLGSWMAGSGESLITIGRILNHSTPAVTQVYARLNVDPIRQALERNAARMLAVTGDMNVMEGTDNATKEKQ